jgi:ACS family tartrate transporter-like MFS transporter
LSIYLPDWHPSYAALDMMRDLGLSASAYGLGAGIFFIGYLLFEIPAAMLVERSSARIWLARMMIVWGIASTLTGFARSVSEFYFLRALIGIAEAGFFPGILIYLGRWFPRADRARAIGALAVGLPSANVIGALLSSWLLRQHWFQIPGWRWMFIVEGFPSVVGGVITLRYFLDSPRQAEWLSQQECEWLEGRLAADRAELAPPVSTGFGGVFKESRLLILALIWFLANTGVYGFNFWLPMMMKRVSGFSAATVVTLASMPFVGALVSALLVSISSDRTGERRFHTALPLTVLSLGLVGSVVYKDTPLLALGMLCIAALGLTSGTPGFWALAADSKAASNSTRIAILTSCGALGGFCGPYLVGALREGSNDFSTALIALASGVIAAALLVFTIRLERRPATT